MDGKPETQSSVGVPAGSFVVAAMIVQHCKVVVTESIIFSEPQYPRCIRIPIFRVRISFFGYSALGFDK